MALRLLCLVLLVWLPGFTWSQPVSCAPSALGNPCASGDPIIQGNAEPGLTLSLGNPIHLATGNKYQQEVDIPANPSAPYLQLVRHYNSLNPAFSIFGTGWTSSYDTRLYQAAGRFQIIQADGSRIDFGRQTQWPAHGPRGTLQPEAEQWRWTWPNGQRLYFDAQGQLLRIVSPQGHATLDIIRHKQPSLLRGHIHKVVSNHTKPGHKATSAALHFHYRIHHKLAYLDAIDTPYGRLNYHYEPLTKTEPPAQQDTQPRLRLAAISQPHGLKRHYRYEAPDQGGNPALLTGIELALPGHTSLRLNTWSYDGQGRTIRAAVHHPAQSAHLLHITYQQEATRQQTGLTLVEQANGRQTRLYFAKYPERYALLRVQGAACPGCAPAGSTAAYDQNARPVRLNQLELSWHDSGHLKRLIPNVAGWPGLHLEFDGKGRRHTWYSTATQYERMLFNTDSKPRERLFANGDQWHYQYDSRHRPIKIIQRNRNATLSSRLSWRGSQLTGIRHPHENESRRYDSWGRLVARHIERPAKGTYAAPVRYREQFEYDAQHRLITHHLPEGGSLHYAWAASGTLLRIDWHGATGQQHNIIRAWPEQPGYRYGNGLGLALHYENGTVNAAGLYDANTLLWDQFRVHDAHGRLQREADQFASLGLTRQWRYVYDTRSRLAIAQSSHRKHYWYAWQADGKAAAVRHQEQTERPAAVRDPSGLPAQTQGHDLRYGPHRRLEQVWRGTKLLDEYRHNAFGHRIQATTPTEHIQYFYLDNRLVAESRQPALSNAPSEGRLITRRYIYTQHAIVGMIDYSKEHPKGVFYAVHTDLLGVPRLITDEQRQIRWRAELSPTGQTVHLEGDLQFDLRLPGQIADATTGWHDNLLRSYQPQFGHYLEPDPIGPLPATQVFGYADQQARRYTDPLGLLLFAFDGTRQNADSRSNVWYLSRRYLDGSVFYHSGPGNPYYLDMDAVVAHSAAQTTLETQWQHLLNSMQGAAARPDQAIAIDVIGFSRGAALARHFGNLVSQHVKQGLFSYADPLRGQISACVDLRFMGLFDSVAQFGLAGALNDQYDFTISGNWSWVAHAVALHERRWLFPLLAATDGSAHNVVEAPFIGAHADIGGGIPVGQNNRVGEPGDLSDVALNWMLWQAKAASVPLASLDSDQALVSQAIMHDERSSLTRSIQDGDRRVDTPSDRKMHDYQDDHTRLGRQQRQATEALITRYEDWRRNDSNAVGEIDIQAYTQWLQEELGWAAQLGQATIKEIHAII